MRTTGIATLLIVASALATGCGKDTRATDQPQHVQRRASNTDALFRQRPQVGVACRHANSIRCDRVGVAVWLRRPASGVNVKVAGHSVRLRVPDGARDWWEGFLKPAGLLDGALRVHPDRGRYYWQGFHPKNVRLVVTITWPDQTADRIATTVPLGAGWG